MYDIQPATSDLRTNCDKPIKTEIGGVITTLKNRKPTGTDEISLEFIKTDTKTSVDILHNLFRKIWEREEIPEELKEGILIKLP